MRKVLIIGSSGAGKTVHAVKLGKLLQLPVVHLDAHHWKPGWERPSRDDWHTIVDALVKQDSWIMDGNYGGTLEGRLNACDAVILLAFPRLTCMYRILKRALTYLGRARPDLNPGCVEQLPDKKFLSWVWNYPKKGMPTVLDRLRSSGGNKEIYLLASPLQVRQFLSVIEGQSNAYRGVQFRQATMDDLDGIHQLRREAILGITSGHFSSVELQTWADRRSPDFFAPLVDGDAVVIAESTAGAVAWGASVEDKITGLYVSPSSNRSGIGRRLAARLESDIARRGYCSARLASSPNVVGFYTKIGYEKIAAGDHYSTPMQKELTLGRQYAT